LSIILEPSSLSQNAYLSVYVSHSFLCANLAYTDKVNGRTFFLKDKSFLLNDLENLTDLEFADYWLNYFKTLEKKWNWDILQLPKISKSGLMVDFTKFKSEKVGVSGCKVSVSKSNVHYKRIFESLRRFSLNIKIVGISKDSDSELLEKFTNLIEYDDVLLLDLHSRFFKMVRVEKQEEKKKKDLSKIHLPRYNYSDVKIRWGSVVELLDLLNAGKYKTFVSKHLPSNLMSNIWGNFLQNPVFRTDSEILRDFVRAYITIQLLSLCSDNPKISKDFGVKPGKNLLWLTGDLIDIPNFKELLIAIIDGLQLRGSFDLVLDEDSLIYTFGKAFCLGENSDEIVLKKESFLPKFTKVLAPDIDLRPDSRKALFHGALYGRKDESTDVFAMSSEITQIKIKDPKTMYLEGRFVKSAYIEKYKKDFEIQCSENGIDFEQIVLDCRIKPVTYGPNVRVNNIKFNMWLSGEHYS
jgi:hypothetical protein